MVEILYDAYKNLVRNSGIFECYQKSTAIATLQDYIESISKDEVNIDKESIDLFNDIKEKINKYKIIIIDLKAITSLNLALLLNNHLSIKPVLSFNHIYHPYGIIGNFQETELIIKTALKLENITPKSYCFILDYNRYLEEEVNLSELQFDNQYEITDEELPYEYMLRKIKCEEVLIITYKKMKEDLEYYKNYLIEQNIKVITYNLE